MSQAPPGMLAATGRAPPCDRALYTESCRRDAAPYHLLQHGLQGWCPPLPVLRRLGVRTRGEIDREKYALANVMAGSVH